MMARCTVAIGMVIAVVTITKGVAPVGPQVSRVGAPVVHSVIPSSSVTVLADGRQRFQTIDGFGVNANSASWANGRLIPALDLLTGTAGASVWRVVVESTQGWETTNDNSDPFTFNWAYYDALYKTPKFQNLWGVLGYLQHKGVPTIMLNVMGCAPDWIGGCTISPSKEDEYVEMEASLLYYAHTVKHLRIDIFGPMNEEDYGHSEGPAVGSMQYVRILDKLSARLDALGLGHIRLLGPDTASVAAATSDYIPALLADPALMAKIDHFGLHSYSGESGGVAGVISGSAYPDRNYWMTEYSTWCDGCDTGAPNPNDWAFAAGTLDYLFNHIEQGAASALVWEAYDSYYEHHASMSYWGLLAYDATARVYVPRKQFYTLAQIMAFIRPGMVRIGSSTSDTALRTLAFTDPATGALTIVGHNTTNATVKLSGTLTNLPAVSRLAFYQTTPTRNLARSTDVPITNGRFTALVEADSVFTLSTHPLTTPTPPTGSPTVRPSVTPTTPATHTRSRTGALGYMMVGSRTDTGDANYLNGSRFTTGGDGGTVRSMSVYVGAVGAAPNNQYQLGIYSDSNGSPGGLVAHSASGTLRANAWNTLPVNAALSPNTAYWLVYNTNGPSATRNNMKYDSPISSVTGAYSNQRVTFGTWPSNFGASTVDRSWAFSIYAGYGP